MADAEVGEFDVTVVGHQQILELDVSVSYAVGVEVGDCAQQLLEDAVLVFWFEISFVDKTEEFALVTVLHDVIPFAVVGTQPHSLNDVGVIAAFGDGVFGLDFAGVVFLALFDVALPKLLDGKLLAISFALSDHDADGGRGTLADLFAPTKLAGRHKLIVEFAGVDYEFVFRLDGEPSRPRPGTFRCRQ